MSLVFRPVLWVPGSVSKAFQFGSGGGAILVDGVESETPLRVLDKRYAEGFIKRLSSPMASVS